MDARLALLKDLNEGLTVTLLALADLEEEQGDRQRAQGWRWLAEKERWPIQVNDKWEWWLLRKERVYQCSLPKQLTDYMRRELHVPKGETFRFATAAEALQTAATFAGMLEILHENQDRGKGATR